MSNNPAPEEPQQPYNQPGAGTDFINQLGVDNVTPAAAQPVPVAPVVPQVPPVQPVVPTATPVAPVTPTENFDINKIIQDVQADAEKQKAELLAQVKEDVGKTQYKKEEVNTILQKAFETFQANQAKTQETINAEINSMKERLANVDSEISSRSSKIQGGNNPYRFQNPTTGNPRDWFEDPNTSNEDKVARFKEVLRNQ